MLVINEAKIVSAHNLLGEMENKELVYTTRGILNNESDKVQREYGSAPLDGQ